MGARKAEVAALMLRTFVRAIERANHLALAARHRVSKLDYVGGAQLASFI
jgi:hypothetical protein